MTHAYHLVTVKISQTITYEQSKGKQPPKFVSNPEPIYINEHFTTGSNFKPITYTLPHITDPQGNGILPVVITNINDFTFVTFDPVFNRITINPNKISK